MVWIITGCTAPTQIPTPSTTPTTENTLRITITGIVDKQSRLPVKGASLTLTWEEPDGTTRSEKPELNFPVTTRINADGETYLSVRVEAEGYRNFELQFRGKADKNKFIEFPVELERIETNNKNL